MRKTVADSVTDRDATATPRHRDSARARWTSRDAAFGPIALLALVSAFGVLLVALGNNHARTATFGAEPLFWAGLVLIYAPIVARLLSTSASRGERIALIAILSIALFFVKVLYSPLHFEFYDELGWWRATHDLLRVGDSWSDNPLVITTPGFPGLDLFTAPLSSLGRLSIFDAGTILIGVVRTALMLSLFLFFERATRSTRAAGIAVAVYVCNPSFLYFNAQFAYESMALLLGLALLLLTIRWSHAQELGRAAVRGLLVAMALLVLTLTITHHMTTYGMLGLLALWAFFTYLREPQGNLLQTPALPAIMLGIPASIWFAFVAGDLTVTELGDIFTGTIRAAIDLVFGGERPKKPFEAGGQTNSTLARGIAVISVLALLAMLPLGLRKIWRSSARDPLQRTLTVIALFYVATLAIRLTASGTETSQRASEFVFIGLAFLTAVVVTDFRRVRDSFAWRLGLVALATVVFIGGFVIGEPPQGRQPGPFLVSAERRSVSAQGLAAADFAAAELPPESRILVDHANGILMGSYGDLNPVTRRVDGIAIARVFRDRSFGPAVRRVIIRGRIAYVVVDRRLARSAPVGGYYFTREEPGAFTNSKPISRRALNKFSLVPELTKIYSNGAIAIYDTAGLRE
jgi:hypothetical protein